jgi:four helix bundle protein
MKSYRELEVWRKSKDLAVQLYRATERFPRNEQFGLTAQIRRAATSCPANIAEGWGRGSTREYIQFLLIARGSILEVETHLLIAAELGYLTPDQLRGFQDQIENIGQMLNRLIQALRARQSVRSAPKPEPRAPSPVA